MDSYRTQELKDFYYSELTEDIIPFWQKHGLDPEQGGFFNNLDRTGALLSTDKGGAAQGRGVWTFSTLLKEVEDKKEWLMAARNGVRFIREKLRRKSDGRVFCEVSRKGDPLILGDDPSAESCAAMGLAAYAQVSGDKKALEEARELFMLALRLQKTMDLPFNQEVRPVRELSTVLRTILLCQTLRDADMENASVYTEKIDRAIQEIFQYFVKANLQILLTSVGGEGELLEGPKGRSMNTGLTFETLATLLEEASYRSDRKLLEKVLPLLRWSIELSWDEECGGLYSFIDAEGRQPAQLEWDMKIWRPHCSAAYAFLLVLSLTGAPSYEKWFETIQEYMWDHFPDREMGEWFGYLRRDGTVQMDLKGNNEKGLYDLPRFLMKTYRLLENMQRVSP